MKTLVRYVGDRHRFAALAAASEEAAQIGFWLRIRNPERYTPITVSAQAGLIVWWRCATGHEWGEAVATRVGT